MISSSRLRYLLFFDEVLETEANAVRGVHYPEDGIWVDGSVQHSEGRIVLH